MAEDDQPENFRYIHLWVSVDGESHIKECKMSGFKIQAYSSAPQFVRDEFANPGKLFSQSSLSVFKRLFILRHKFSLLRLFPALGTYRQPMEQSMCSSQEKFCSRTAQILLPLISLVNIIPVLLGMFLVTK